jgi:hypothetical protein
MELSSMTRIAWIRVAWIVAVVAIITGLVAAMVPLGPGIQDARAQEVTPPPPPPQPVLKPAPATPIAEQKAELGDDRTWNPEWDLFVEQAIPGDMLAPQVARAVKPFCPRFNALSDADKRVFWAYFFQALAGAEAGLVPTANVRHMDPVLQVKDDVTHRMIRQEGLLQLTYMDQQRYGCDFDWEKDKALLEHDPDKTILQPRNNLLCGVNIIRKQVIDQHKPLLSSTSYFATLQPGTISVKVFLRQMANVPAVCGPRVRTEPRPAATMREAAASGSPSSDSGLRPSFASDPAAETH